jgi:ABC-type multidrug transport system fused ATPase/permease subunit
MAGAGHLEGGGGATIQIAHRLSTIANSSSIAVLDHGAVAELGDVSELTAREGKFSEFVKQQKLVD